MSDSFEETLLDIINKSALSLMLSVGHRTKLFDVMSNLPPSTSDEIATRCNLNERYVREWLGSMVTGKIIKYDPENKKYFLPQDRVDLLTSKTKSFNFAASSQWIPALAQVEDQIVNCFKKGGGVPYSSYARFHEIMAEESAQTVLPGLIGDVLPLVPGLVDRLEKGIVVLDVGCGSGKAINLMAKHFPRSNFTGYDISEEAVTYGTSEASQMGLSNTRFQKQDVTNFPKEEKFDLICAFDAIHDQAQPSKVLQNISDALKPNGIFLMQDIAASSDLKKNMDHPIGPFLYTISCLHCMSVSLAQNGVGLGAVWGKELATEMLRKAGFTKVDVKQLLHDFQNFYYVARKD